MFKCIMEYGQNKNRTSNNNIIHEQHTLPIVIFFLNAPDIYNHQPVDVRRIR